MYTFKFEFEFEFEFDFDLDLQTLKFKALLLVWSFASSIVRQTQELAITIDPSIPKVDLATDDFHFNSITTTTPLCRKGDGKPWKGAEEKFEVSMKLFVHCLSPIGGIMANMTTSTGIVINL